MRHYLNVITRGPLVIVRIPWPRPRWRDVLKALTVLMTTHGYRQKDIVAIEGMTHYAPDDTPDKVFRWNEKAAAADVALRGRLAAAFDGDPSILPTFWLYDWDGREFVLARPAAQR
jgi:hypothetical protein